MRGRSGPLQAPAEVAGIVLAVARCAQRCVLAFLPTASGVPILGEAKVAEAARAPTAVHTGTVQGRGVRGYGQDLQHLASPGSPPGLGPMLALVLETKLQPFSDAAIQRRRQMKEYLTAKTWYPHTMLMRIFF